MHLALAANPGSGGGVDPDRLHRHLQQGGADVTRLELDDLDGPLPAGTERLVIAGGDGSIGVAARAANTAGVSLAVVPTGTANDFARAAGLPDDPEQACALAADPQAATRCYEIGELGGRPFVNAAAVGLSAVASRHAEPHKSRLGALAYAWGAIRAGLTAPVLPCRVRCDGAECFTGQVWQVVIGLTGAFGGGSEIGQTLREDGLMDVAIVPAGPRLALMRRAYGMRRGTLTDQEQVTHLRGTVVEVDLPGGAAFNVDGDLREARPARFTLLPGGVAVVVG